MLFHSLVALVIVQRIIELVVARRNLKWALARGGVEYGAEHYKYIVLLHISFFLSLIIEYHLHPSLSPAWVLFILLYLAVQVIRVWSIVTLGKHWNTRVIVIPDTELIQNGPYRYVKHPNYIVVALEIILLSLIFQAYVTAFAFSLLNFYLITFVRIPVENKALTHLKPTNR